MSTLSHEEMTLRQRVLAGGLFLTVLRGDEWWNQINLDRLDLDSLFDCILGQLYTSFGDGVERFDLTEGDTYAFGFNLYIPSGYSSTLAAIEFEALTEEWKELIRALRSDVSES
ncbi:hypothetical protein AB0C87_24795 [Actinomadura sp. NPDC048021]|uniref:hypothetical protein n=1 Tax=Actinomadura sp. NPDC048021 TaxID=3155385 RepID=UPI0033EC1CC0